MLLLMLHRSNGILIIDYDDGDDRPRTDSEQAPKTEQRPTSAQVMSADADDAPRRQMRRRHTRKEDTGKFLSVTRCVCVCVGQVKVTLRIGGSMTDYQLFVSLSLLQWPRYLSLSLCWL